MGTVSALSAGNAALAMMAVLLATYEAWLYVRAGWRGEHLWVSLICASAAVYAGCVAIHYDASRDLALWLTRVEGAAMIVLVHVTAGFAGVAVGRSVPPGNTFWAVSCLFLCVLSLSPWLIPFVEPMHMSLLPHPFWRRPQGGLLTLVQLYGTTPILGGLYWLYKHRHRGAQEFRALAIGLCLWLAPTLASFVLSVLHRPLPFSMAEYGFVAFAFAMVARDTQRFVRSERNFKTLIERSPDAIAVLRDDRVLYANRAALTLFGFEEVRDVTEKQWTELFGDPPPATTDAVIELRVSRLGQRVVDAELTSLDLEFDGAPATLVVLRDVSERKQLTARMMEVDRMVAVGTLARELESRSFGAILTDLQMPGNSGVELYNWIEGRWPDLTRSVLFMSGGTFTPEAASFRETFADRFVYEPLDMKSLRRRLRDIAERHAACAGEGSSAARG